MQNKRLKMALGYNFLSSISGGLCVSISPSNGPYLKKKEKTRLFSGNAVTPNGLPLVK
jgi:hypothetical protein